MIRQAAVVLAGHFICMAYAQQPATSSNPDATLMNDLAQRAAFMQAWVDYCRANAADTLEANERALSEWHQRNRWRTFETALASRPNFTEAWQRLHGEFVRKLEANGREGPKACRYVPALMRRAEYDPSANRSADLNRIADVLEAKATAAPAAPTASTSGSVQAGEVTFTPAPGWRIAKQSPTMVTLQHSGPKGQPSMAIIGSESLQDDVKGSLARLAEGSFRDFDLKLTHVQARVTAHGLPAAFFDDDARHRTRRLRVRILGAGVAVNGRMQVALAMTPDGADSYDRKREFEQMVISWRFRNAPAAWDPLRPPAGSGGVEGLYWGSSIQNRLNPLGGMDLVAERHYLLLLQNGQAFRDLPTGGKVLDMDFAAARQKTPQKCGTYTVRGQEIVIDWLSEYGFVERETIPVKGTGNNMLFQQGGAGMRLARPVDGLRLNGRYTSSTFVSSSGAFSSTSVASQTYILFTPDGRYQKSGFVGFSFSNETGSGRTTGAGKSDKRAETGTYSFRGFRLTLKPDAGPEEQFTAIFEDPSPTTKLVLIDDKAFLMR